MAESSVNDILSSAVSKEGTPIDPNSLSLEQLILLINSERLKTLQDKTQNEFKELKTRQQNVKELHDILKAINKATGEDGYLDASGNGELQKLLDKARELGADVKEGKTSFNREERERLVENIRMTVEDLNVQNDMQLQTISRLTNERYESYQMARSILKPLHEAKTSYARGMRGAA